MKKTNEEIREILRKKRELKKQENCAICLEPTSKTIKCGHYFHKKCLEKWEQYNSCPICRAPIDETKKVEKFKYSNEEEDAMLARELSENRVSPDMFYLLLQGLLGSRLGNPLSIPRSNRLNNNIMDISVFCRGCRLELGHDFPVINCDQCNEGHFCCDVCRDLCPCRRRTGALRESRRRVGIRRNIREEREGLVRQVEAEFANQESSPKLTHETTSESKQNE